MILRTSFSQCFEDGFSPSPFSQFATWILFHMTQTFTIWYHYSDLCIYSPAKKILGRPCQGVIQNYSICLNFQGDLRKWDGPMVLNPPSKHPDITTSWLAEDGCAPFKAQETRLPAGHLLRWGVRGWGGPTPLQRLLSLWKSKSPGRGGKKQVDTAASSLPHAHCTLLLRMQGSTSV